MPLKDILIAVTIMLVCVIGFRPALNNFKIVLSAKNDSRISPGMRMFVLFWFGLGLVCIVLGFFVIAYSIGARLGYLPDFKVG